jgi:hypothetical protein
VINYFMQKHENKLEDDYANGIIGATLGKLQDQ